MQISIIKSTIEIYMFYWQINEINFEENKIRTLYPMNKFVLIHRTIPNAQKVDFPKIPNSTININNILILKQKHRPYNLLTIKHCTVRLTCSFPLRIKKKQNNYNVCCQTHAVNNPNKSTSNVIMTEFRRDTYTETGWSAPGWWPTWRSVVGDWTARPVGRSVYWQLGGQRSWRQRRSWWSSSGACRPVEQWTSPPLVPPPPPLLRTHSPVLCRSHRPLS